MNKPKVSVNIACYNHGRFIKETIQSVLDQTFQDFEIIICDNGSTDNSLEIINSFKDERIKVHHIDVNQQSTYAGNDCIQRGCGEYVALLCSDDAWEPTKLEKQVKYLDEHPSTGVVFSRVQPFDENSKYNYSKNNFYYEHFNLLENRTRHEWLFDMFLTCDHSFCCSSACVRRECFIKLGLLDIRAKHIQDFIFWVDVCVHYDVHILDEKLTKMRYFKEDTNLGALSDKTIIASLNEMMMLYEKFKKIKDIEDFLKVFPMTPKYFNVIDEKYIPFYLALLTLKIPHVRNFKDAGLHLLYDYMQSPENRENLEKDFGFTHMKLYDIATEHDTFRHYNASRTELFMIIASRVCDFLSKYILGIWMEEELIKFKFFGILKTHIHRKFTPKEIIFDFEQPSVEDSIQEQNEETRSFCKK